MQSYPYLISVNFLSSQWKRENGIKSGPQLLLPSSGINAYFKTKFLLFRRLFGQLDRDTNN